MVERLPAWKHACCCESSRRYARPICTSPGSTRSSSAPRNVMAPCFAKLARVRAWKSGFAGAKSVSAPDRRDFGERKSVEVARVRRGVRARVLDEDEIVLLQVRGEELFAHHHVHRVACGTRDVPRDGLAVAVGIDVVAQPFGR